MSAAAAEETVAQACTRTHARTYSDTAALLSALQIFRGSDGRSSSAIQLRISVPQLNSAVPEQNERPKPSGEESADKPHPQSPAGNTVSPQAFTQRQRGEFRERARVCVCVRTLHISVARAWVTSDTLYPLNYAAATRCVIYDDEMCVIKTKTRIKG